MTVPSTTALPLRYRFASRRHPGDAHAGLVYGRALTGPLSFTMVLVMIMATASMLLGVDPVGWVIIVTPAAIALAGLFAAHWMRRTPAELVLVGDQAGVRSVWEVATNRAPETGQLLPPRKVQDGIDVGIGEDVLTLTLREWPDLAEIEATMKELVPLVRPDTW